MTGCRLTNQVQEPHAELDVTRVRHNRLGGREGGRAVGRGLGKERQASRRSSLRVRASLFPDRYKGTEREHRQGALGQCDREQWSAECSQHSIRPSRGNVSSRRAKRSAYRSKESTRTIIMAIDKKTDDYHITRPPTQSRSQAFFQFLYNPRTHEVLGRTAKSWLQIIVFYIVLYSFLAGFFAGLLMVFFQTLNVEQPTWTMEASLIGTNPGLGFRPLHPSPDQTAIVFNSKDSKSVALWKKAVDDFLEPYYGGNSDDFTDCTYGSEPPKDKPCRFVVALDKCGKDNYGYDTNMPCIYLKVNKIFGWQPDCYPQTAIDDETLKDMPQTLKDKIKTLSTQAGSNNIWASCTTSSDSPTDNQNITLTYDGHFGFPNYYYPYSNQKNYRTPFIALQVHGLPDDVSVKVSCQLWANNINVDRQRRLGMTTFEMMSQTKA